MQVKEWIALGIARRFFWQAFDCDIAFEFS